MKKRVPKSECTRKIEWDRSVLKILIFWSRSKVYLVKAFFFLSPLFFFFFAGGSDRVRFPGRSNRLVGVTAFRLEGQKGDGEPPFFCFSALNVIFYFQTSVQTSLTLSAFEFAKADFLYFSCLCLRSFLYKGMLFAFLHH